MIKLDRSASSVVVRCRECPSFRELANDSIEAARLGAKHKRDVHREPRAGDALTAAIRRRRSIG